MVKLWQRFMAVHHRTGWPVTDQRWRGCPKTNQPGKNAGHRTAKKSCCQRSRNQRASRRPFKRRRSHQQRLHIRFVITTLLAGVIIQFQKLESHLTRYETTIIIKRLPAVGLSAQRRQFFWRRLFVITNNSLPIPPFSFNWKNVWPDFMKPIFRVSVADLLFSALLGALAVIIYRRLRNPPAPPRPATSPRLRERVADADGRLMRTAWHSSLPGDRGTAPRHRG